MKTILNKIETYLVLSLLFVLNLTFAQTEANLAKTDLSEHQTFDSHVHIWNGEKSVKEYLEQLDSLEHKLAGFGAIYMAEEGKLDITRAKNNELITLSKKYTKLIPICSIHPYDGVAALLELERNGYME